MAKSARVISGQFSRIRPVGNKKLLIVKLDSIGDYLLFRNFLTAIVNSQKFKGYEVTLCGNNIWKELSEKLDSALISRFIWVDVKGMTDEDYQEQLCSLLREQRFTVAITPTHSRSWQTDRLMLGSGAREKIASMGDSVNIAPDQKLINDKEYTLLISDPAPLAFEFERNRVFLSKLLDESMDKIQPVIPRSAAAEDLVLVCPGAQSVARQWAPRNFYRLCEYLQHALPGSKFMICGAASEKFIAESIISTGSTVQFTDLTGKLELGSLLDHMSNSSLVLCNDSAPYHMASLLNIPAICISNGNHFGRFCPYPASYHKKNLEIFPPVLSLPPSFEKIAQLQHSGSSYNINEITPSGVISEIEKSGFLHDLIHHNH